MKRYIFASGLGGGLLGWAFTGEHFGILFAAWVCAAVSWMVVSK